MEESGGKFRIACSGMAGRMRCLRLCRNQPRHVFCARSLSLQIWRLGSAGYPGQGEGLSRLADGTPLNVTESPALLLEVKPKNKNNIYSAAISRYEVGQRLLSSLVSRGRCCVCERGVLLPINISRPKI